MTTNIWENCHTTATTKICANFQQYTPSSSAAIRNEKAAAAAAATTIYAIIANTQHQRHQHQKQQRQPHLKYHQHQQQQQQQQTKTIAQNKTTTTTTTIKTKYNVGKKVLAKINKWFLLLGVSNGIATNGVRSGSSGSNNNSNNNNNTTTNITNVNLNSNINCSRNGNSCCSSASGSNIGFGFGNAMDVNAYRCFYIIFLVLSYCCLIIRAAQQSTLVAHEQQQQQHEMPATVMSATADKLQTGIDEPETGRVRHDDAETIKTLNLSTVNGSRDDINTLSSSSNDKNVAEVVHVVDDEPAGMDDVNRNNNNNKYNTSINNVTDNNCNENYVKLKTIEQNTRDDDERQQYRIRRRDVFAANVPANNEAADADDDSAYRDEEFDQYDSLIKNKSAKGKYIGAPCNNMKCEATLLHVICDKETHTCGCERNYPVQLGLTKGCDKPKRLGEQCFYDETCIYNDENSLCVQVRHNALCQCVSGFHSVSYTKPTRRVFCTQDLKELTSDLPTLLGVSTGIAVLAGLICMVLHLFSKTKYPRHRNFGDAGLPITVHSGRPSSRSSLRSSDSIGSYANRRSSSGGAGGIGGASGGGGASGSGGAGGSGGIGGGSKGILVSTSRTGSRRPSLASVHSTSSSVRSYSMMRFEKETQQKEIRQEMKLRLARLQQQQQLNQNKPQIVIGDSLFMQHHGAISRISAITGTHGSSTSMATPSPLTPNSLDELLPTVEEMQEYPIKPDVSTSRANNFVAAVTLSAIKNVTAPISVTTATANAIAITTSLNDNSAAISPQIIENAAYVGPCSSSTEALD